MCISRFGMTRHRDTCDIICSFPLPPLLLQCFEKSQVASPRWAPSILSRKTSWLLYYWFEKLWLCKLLLIEIVVPTSLMFFVYWVVFVDPLDWPIYCEPSLRGRCCCCSISDHLNSLVIFKVVALFEASSPANFDSHDFSAFPGRAREIHFFHWFTKCSLLLL